MQVIQSLGTRTHLTVHKPVYQKTNQIKKGGGRMGALTSLALDFWAWARCLFRLRSAWVLCKCWGHAQAWGGGMLISDFLFHPSLLSLKGKALWPVGSHSVTHLSYHYLLLGMCYEQRSDLLSVHSHHFPKRLHCFVETGGHDRMGGTEIL